MAHKHLLIIDPLESLRQEIDTSLGLARALMAAGHEVWITELRQLFWDSAHAGVHAQVQQLSFMGTHAQRVGTLLQRPCEEFASVLMRKDPPVDFSYLAATWLLDSLKGKTRVYNAPTAVRSINEKLGIFSLADAAHPALVSADPPQLLAFIEQRCGGDGISKPLDGFGGQGVERLNLAELGGENTLARLHVQTAGGQQLRIVQRFCPEIFQGEVRAFALGGKVLSWCLKKPAAGSYLANTGQGATLSSYKPSPALAKKITQVARRLWQDHGLAFVGFDIIDSKISEVNVTSPRLLQGKDDTTNYYHLMAQWLIDQCATPLHTAVRKPHDEL
jgi:glutathione synthase